MLNNQWPGANNAIEYLVSAIPWVTASTVTGVRRFDFPHVTAFYTVKNESTATIKVGYTERGVTTSNNYFTLDAAESYTGYHRVKSLFISGSGGASIELVVGLTQIPDRFFPPLTGSVDITGLG